MPRVRRSTGSRRRYTTKRKAYKRTAYRKRRNQNSAVSRNLIGFPKNQYVHMRYCETLSLDGSSVISPKIYRANSIYDPDYSTGGHQPMGYETWLKLYNQYIVVKSRCKMTVCQVATATGEPFYASLGLQNAVDTRTMIERLETGDTTMKLMQGATAYGNKGTTLIRWFDQKKFFNLTDIKDNWDEAGANINDNPINTALFNLAIGAADGTTETGTYKICVQIDYWVLFGEPQILAQSG